jgi:hypothetical protein
VPNAQDSRQTCLLLADDRPLDAKDGEASTSVEDVVHISAGQPALMANRAA